MKNYFREYWTRFGGKKRKKEERSGMLREIMNLMFLEMTYFKNARKVFKDTRDRSDRDAG